MKQIVFIFLVLASINVYSQNKNIANDFLPNNNNYRVKSMEYFEVSKDPKFRYEYKYSKEGLIKSITKKHKVDNSWQPLETKEFEYDFKSKSIICVNKPSAMSDGAIDFAKMREIKKQKKDVDTFKIENGRVIYLAQFRKGKYNNYLYQYKYTYEKGNLTSVNKTSYTYIESTINGETVSKPYLSKDIWNVNFSYENNKIRNIIQKETSFTRKWVLSWNEQNLEKIDIYNKNNDEEKLAIEYECKNENGRLTKMIDFMIDNDRRSLIEAWSYTYDNNNCLIESRLNDDSGFFIYNYSYEPGNGNISLFEEMKMVSDYIKPFIK